MSFKSTLRTVLTLGRGVYRGLPEASEHHDPIELLRQWYTEAERSGVMLPEAMTLATCTRDAVPSARLVLLKGIDQDGLVFYTNYGSRKSEELDANPRAALVLYWAVLQRQIRIEGSVSRVSGDESDAYFQTRPRGSQIGAWASRQSQILRERAQLEARMREFTARFKDGAVPTPEFWGGYRVVPECIEFWQGRADRLHDRLRFERTGTGWTRQRLYP